MNSHIDKPIRVLQVIGIVAGGGVESVVMNYYKNIDREQVQFDFIVHYNNKVDISNDVEALGGKVYKITPYNENIFSFMKSIYKIVKNNNYKIVHSHMTTLSFFSLFPAWLAGAKIRIMHGHSTTVKSEWKRNILKLLLRPLSQCVANKYWACSRLVASWLYGKNNKKIHIINNAIVLKNFSYSLNLRNKYRKLLNINDAFVIGHVGRFAYQKNHEFLIKFFRRLLDKKKGNFILLLIGDGPLREESLNLIKNLNLDNHVIYLGLRDDLSRLYNVMDILCLPSRYEGLPVVAIEAQSNGLPIIMSNAVTDEAILVPEIAVRLGIENNDIDNWIEKIYEFQQENKRGINTTYRLNDCGYNIKHEANRMLLLYKGYYDEEY